MHHCLIICAMSDKSLVFMHYITSPVPVNGTILAPSIERGASFIDTQKYQ